MGGLRRHFLRKIKNVPRGTLSKYLPDYVVFPPTYATHETTYTYTTQCGTSSDTIIVGIGLRMYSP